MSLTPEIDETAGDDKSALIDRIRELAVVYGRVTLSSGREADYYVDMRRVTLDGVAAPIVGRVMRKLVADWDFEAVGGLTLGADPVATSMLHAAAAGGERLDVFVVRKEAKKHGMQRRIEGTMSPGVGCWSWRTRVRPAALHWPPSRPYERRARRWSA